MIGQCGSSSSIDCTRWSPDLVSLLESPQSSALFPNVDAESRTASGQFCVDSLKVHLASAFIAEPLDGENEECYTNCTATLSNECSISVFLLENINSRRIPDLRSPGTVIPAECGIFELTPCCIESLPSECFSKNLGSVMVVVVIQCMCRCTFGPVLTCAEQNRFSSEEHLKMCT